MAFKTTRDQRAQRWRIVPNLIAATFAFSACQFVCASGSMAQVKAPNKNHLKAPTKSTSTAPSEDVQPFAIGTDGSVADQLTALRIDPSDAQAAADAVSKALEQLDRKTTSSGRAVLASQGADKPKRLVTLQLYSAKSLAVELHRGADGSYGFKLAPNATENDDERVSSLPSTTQAAGARRPLGRGRLGWPGEGQRQLRAWRPASPRPAPAAPPSRNSARRWQASPAPRSRSGRAARSMVRRGCLPPPSAKARPRSRSGGLRHRTSRKAGSTRAAAGSAARHSRSPAAARASPRRSAFAATTAARAAAASTTASISRARPACRSMRQPTARSITRAGTSTTAAR